MSTIEIHEMNPQTLSDLMNEELQDRKRHKLTQENIASIRMYIDQKIRPGGFLEAVLRNDLKEALGRADCKNRRKIFEWVEYLYNYAPAICWGSNDKVDAWLNERENEKV